jgi:hypothetical protein
MKGRMPLPSRKEKVSLIHCFTCLPAGRLLKTMEQWTHEAIYLFSVWQGHPVWGQPAYCTGGAGMSKVVTFIAAVIIFFATNAPQSALAATPPLGPTPNPAPGCVELLLDADGGFTIQGETYVGVSRLLNRAEIFLPGQIAAGTKIYTLSRVWTCPTLADAEATARQYNAAQNTPAGTPTPTPAPRPSSRLPHG